ncbi:hypothetical protein ACP275_12G138500 [Erythranthe tilingii]
MESNEEYVEFLNKVRRTIYIDNLSPAVTETVVKAAFNQFGDVASVEFIPTFMQPEGVPRAALVEMANITLAQRIITDMNTLSFMIGGLPRPVRAKPAQVEMFDNRPRKPGREIQYSWRRKKDPDFEVAKKIQNVVKRHAAEASFLLEQQLAEEESLAERQAETLRVNCKKLEAMGRVSRDGKRLAERYGIRR